MNRESILGGADGMQQSYSSLGLEEANAHVVRMVTHRQRQQPLEAEASVLQRTEFCQPQRTWKRTLSLR